MGIQLTLEALDMFRRRILRDLQSKETEAETRRVASILDIDLDNLAQLIQEENLRQIQTIRRAAKVLDIDPKKVEELISQVPVPGSPTR
ncbi:MAG TPA: hypothetical protein VJK04_03515 [Candidatus Paceibacterota bacterium]